jgi:tight adherence protein C
MSWTAAIESWLNGAVADPQALRTVFVLVFGAAAFVIAMAVSLAVLGVRDVKKRIGSVRGEHAASPAGATVDALAAGLGGWIVPKDAKKRRSIAAKLQQAGYRSPVAYRRFLAAKVLAMAGVPLAIIAFGMVTRVFPFALALLYALAAVGLGYIMPDAWLARRVRHRQARLRRGLPDALDLMVVCTEAGLGLNAAIQRVSDEIDVQHPDLSDELNLVIMQTRAGIDSRTALKELEQRTGLPDIKAFVTTLLQAMRFGTSIADSLRIFAEEMRDKRLQTVQEQAAKLGVKMLFPVALCMMPSFLLVALGPALLKLTKAFSSLGGMGVPH